MRPAGRADRRPSPASTLESQRLEQLLPTGVVISFALAAIAFAALEWLRWSLSLKPFPIIMPLVAAGFTLWAVFPCHRLLLLSSRCVSATIPGTPDAPSRIRWHEHRRVLP